MFSIWMTIFAVVWLFFIPMFLVMIVGVRCWLRFAWFQPWLDATVCAGYAWVVATVVFLGVMMIRRPERTARH